MIGLFNEQGSPGLFDEKLRSLKNILSFVRQSLLGTGLLAISVIAFYWTMGLDWKNLNLILVGSVGSSFFVVFSTPRLETARPRNMLGGYLISIAVGVMSSSLEQWMFLAPCVAMFGCLLVMSITDTEHPPACGAGVTFSIYAGSVSIELLAVAFTLGTIILLSLFRECFYKGHMAQVPPGRLKAVTSKFISFDLRDL